MPPFAFQWITSNQQLADCLATEAVQSQHYICIDTEFIRRTTYWPKAALIQLHSPAATLLVDPLLIDDWSPLAAILADKSVTKVIHAAGEDLQLLRRLTGKKIWNLFDTQIAYALLDDNHSIGYSSLVAELLDIELEDTRHQCSDWLRRPLNEAQCRYALSDVVYLNDAYHALRASLEQHPQRLDWLHQLCQGQLDQAEQYVTADGSQAWNRIKGVNRVRSIAALKRLRTLAAWRDQTARARDLVRHYLVQDDALVELAIKPPVTRSQWHKLPVGRKFRRAEDTEALQQCIAQATDLSDNEVTLPVLFPKHLSSLYEALRQEKKRIAAELGISQQVLANNKEIQAFILANGKYSFDDWRDQVLLERLQTVYTEEEEPLIK